MSDLYLIAHKVRGEPAFDIAVKMECPICRDVYECAECDSEGFWWIIPTSGHRAFPFWHSDLFGLLEEAHCSVNGWLGNTLANMPEDLPDHYPEVAAPSRPKIDISALLAKTSLQAPFKRRV